MFNIETQINRWFVVCQKWQKISNNTPDFKAFLAGWLMCELDADLPSKSAVGYAPDSFNAGWRECFENKKILAREKVHYFECGGMNGSCLTCGLNALDSVHSK